MNKMKRMRVAIIGVGLILALLVAAPASAVTTTGLRHQMLDATNDSRASRSVPRLLLNDRMSRVAHRHSVAMANAGTLFHTSNVQTYLSGVHWHVWGENVGMTSGSIAHIERMFMHSAPHRNNILNRAFKHVAIGVYQHGGRLWVTVFFYG